MSFAADHHERCSSTTACACFAVAAGVAAVTAIAAAAPSSAATPRAKAWVSERPHGPSPGLRAMLREIDPGRIQSDIHTLLGFGTRHTLSSQDDPQRGIGAAREWIYAQFQSSWSNAVTPRRAKRSPASPRRVIVDGRQRSARRACA